jgi:hydroxymethylbilane synthase
MDPPPPLDKRPLRIGTRGSALAQAQTRLAVARLQERNPALPTPEILVIKTTGDRVQDRPLSEIGGKGLFAKEIEAALLERAIDCAVHSLKDLESHLPRGLVIGAVLPRADPRDALIAPRTAPGGLAALAHGAKVATGSVRRSSQLLALRPDLAIAPLRGNVETRLAKIRAGAADATVLAMAGLERLALAAPEAIPLETAIMLPAAGQGLIAVECRADDEATRGLLAPISDEAAEAAARAERALLAALGGSCRTPIAALAELDADRLRLRALVAQPDGRLIVRTEREGAIAESEALGADAGRELRARAPDEIFLGA